MTIPDGGSLACLEFRGPKFDCPYHVHPEVEITWVMAGEGQRLVGDRLTTFKPGDLVMIGGGLPHMYQNWSADFARSRYIQFRPTVFGAHFFEIPELRPVLSLLGRARRGLAFSEDRTKDAALRQINRLYKLRPGPQRIAVLLELLDLLASDGHARLLASASFHPEPSTGETAHRIFHYIEENWHAGARAENAARAAGMHPRSLSRFFKRCTGTTFQQYLAQLRLGRATKELIESDKRISEVAFRCGFNSLSHFNRLFLKRHGVSPRRFRSTFDARLDPLKSSPTGQRPRSTSQ